MYKRSEEREGHNLAPSQTLTHTYTHALAAAFERIETAPANSLFLSPLLFSSLISHKEPLRSYSQYLPANQPSSKFQLSLSLPLLSLAELFRYHSTHFAHFSRRARPGLAGACTTVRVWLQKATTGQNIVKQNRQTEPE